MMKEHENTHNDHKYEVHGELRSHHKHEEVGEHKVLEPKTEHKIEHKTEHRKVHHKKDKGDKIAKHYWILLGVAVVLVLFNQYQVSSVSSLINSNMGTTGTVSLLRNDLGEIDITSLKSTGHTIAAIFPVETIQTAEDAMVLMFPTGTPDYGEELGVSYDNPVGSLETLSRMYRSLKQEVQQNNPAGFQRFMGLASKPVGISCEYCCGLKTIGIDQNGDSTCGCKHNPALLSIALYLSAYTDYSDGEILREVMRWKTLFFPKNMIELGASLAGGDTSSLKDLPGMVGGC